MKRPMLRLLLGLAGIVVMASSVHALDGTETFMDDPLPVTKRTEPPLPTLPAIAPPTPAAPVTHDTTPAPITPPPPPVKTIKPEVTEPVAVAQAPVKPVKTNKWAVAPEEGDPGPSRAVPPLPKSTKPYPYGDLKDGNSATPAETGTVTPAPRANPETPQAGYPGGPVLAAIIKDEEDARRAQVPLEPAELTKRYRAVAEHDPDNAEAHYRLGVSLMKLRQPEEGLKELEKSVVLKPTTGRYLCGLGRASLQVNDVQRAMEACALAVQSDPGNPFYRNALGNAYLKAGGFDNIRRAAVTYGEAVQLEPKNARYLHNLARALSVGGGIERALEVMNEVILTDPDSASAYNDRGALYERLGDQAKALADYKNSVRIEPDFVQAHINLTLFYSNEKLPTIFNKQAALDHADAAVRLTNRNNPLCLMALAEAFRANRRMDDAIKTAKDAIALEPSQEYLDRLAQYERLKSQPLGAPDRKSTTIRVRE